MKKKRLLAVLAVCGLCLVAGAGLKGTMAYLSDKADQQRMFTFGDVKIDLQEPGWDITDENGNDVPDASEYILPNQQVPKSVQVENTGINDAIIFLKMTVPVAEVTRITDGGRAEKTEDGTLDTKLQEVFYFQSLDDPALTKNNHFHESWINIPEAETGYVGAGGPDAYLDLSKTKGYDGEVRTYVFGYGKRLAKGEKTDLLFDKVQLKDFIENEIEPDTFQNIKIEAYAVQADQLEGSLGRMDTTGDLGHDLLKEIYDLYIPQTTPQEPEDPDEKPENPDENLDKEDPDHDADTKNPDQDAEDGDENVTDPDDEDAKNPDGDNSGENNSDEQAKDQFMTSPQPVVPENPDLHKKPSYK